MKAETLVRFEKVSIGYYGKAFLRNIDISINKDQFWGILGTNGSGKTTFLKTILGLIPPVNGKIRHKENIVFGYVPQHENLDPIFPISVSEIVTMGRYSRIPFGRKVENWDRKIINEAIDKVGISHLKKSGFRFLSGGEKQRALIAKAICSEPDLLILDEPTASLDIKGETEVMSIIQNLKNQNSLTVLMVSHFLNNIIKYTDKILLIDKDNKIFIKGDKEEFLSQGYIKKYFGMGEINNDST